MRYRNILSTGNAWTTIDLDRNKTTLVVGSNGAGKSTMLDAISFALYGRAFRKINKPQLVNTINKKGLLVELDFDVGATEYTIRRGIKPTVFEIWKNGDKVDQDAASRDYQSYLEQNILKLNFKSFGQIVVLGSSTFVPFMQLSSIHRREIIEDLLDIQVFTVMNLLLRDQSGQTKAELRETKYQIDLTEERIATAKQHSEQMRQLREQEVKALRERCAQYNDTIETDMRGIDANLRRIAALNNEIDDLVDVQKQLKRLSDVGKEISTRIGRLQREIEFYDQHDTCPTCQQDLDKMFKQSRVSSRMDLVSQFTEKNQQVRDKLDRLQQRMVQINNVQQQINSIQSDNIATQSRIQVNQDAIRSVERDLNRAQNEIEVTTEDKIREFGQQLDQHTQHHRQLAFDDEINGIVSSLLKDGGIKTQIIRQYVPVMNKLINKYLAAMDFFVQFELDENFDERILSRYRDEFSYSSFSEGEKLRIDLALMFTWRAVSRMRNSVSTNLLIMDEIMDSSLDDAGTEDFLGLITDLAEDSNVFIISHKGDTLKDKFDHVIEFKKIRNFSQISEGN